MLAVVVGASLKKTRTFEHCLVPAGCQDRGTELQNLHQVSLCYGWNLAPSIQSAFLLSPYDHREPVYIPWPVRLG